MSILHRLYEVRRNPPMCLYKALSQKLARLDKHALSKWQDILTVKFQLGYFEQALRQMF